MSICFFYVLTFILNTEFLFKQKNTKFKLLIFTPNLNTVENAVVYSLI